MAAPYSYVAAIYSLHDLRSLTKGVFHVEGSAFCRTGDPQRGWDEQEQGVEDAAGHEGQQDNLEFLRDNYAVKAHSHDVRFTHAGTAGRCGA